MAGIHLVKKYGKEKEGRQEDKEKGRQAQALIVAKPHRWWGFALVLKKLYFWYMLKSIIHAVNIVLTDIIIRQINEKSRDLERFLKHFNPATLELRVEIGLPSRHHRKGEIFYAEANLKIGGKLLRAEEKHFELASAINTTFKELEAQAKKFKEKVTAVKKIKR